LAASLLPVGATFIMVFAPPTDLSGAGLVGWMAIAIIGFYSALTILLVPHLALGAELSTDYHERSRLFGMRHAFFTLGSILALVSFFFLIRAEQQSATAVRALAFELAVFAALVMMGLIAFAAWRLRERPEYQSRPIAAPLRAFADVWRNPHARLLIIVTFIENIGAAAIGVLTLYVAQYVIGAPQWAPFVILCYMIPSTLSVPLWLPLARRFGKIRLWMFSMILTGLSFGAIFGLLWIETLEARLAYIMVAAVLAGLAAGLRRHHRPVHSGRRDRLGRVHHRRTQGGLVLCGVEFRVQECRRGYAAADRVCAGSLRIRAEPAADPDRTDRDPDAVRPVSAGLLRHRRAAVHALSSGRGGARGDSSGDRRPT
jgi:GPH family glycoside/pentoside/hexuronide:cation symporter